MDQALDDTSESGDMLSALSATESLNGCFHLGQSTAVDALVIPFAGLGKKPEKWNKPLPSWSPQTSVQLLQRIAIPNAFTATLNKESLNPGHKKLWTHGHSTGGIM